MCSIHNILLIHSPSCSTEHKTLTSNYYQVLSLSRPSSHSALLPEIFVFLTMADSFLPCIRLLLFNSGRPDVHLITTLPSRTRAENKQFHPAAMASGAKYTPTDINTDNHCSDSLLCSLPVLPLPPTMSPVFQIPTFTGLYLTVNVFSSPLFHSVFFSNMALLHFLSADFPFFVLIVYVIENKEKLFLPLTHSRCLPPSTLTSSLLPPPSHALPSPDHQPLWQLSVLLRHRSH